MVGPDGLYFILNFDRDSLDLLWSFSIPDPQKPHRLPIDPIAAYLWKEMVDLYSCASLFYSSRCIS